MTAARMKLALLSLAGGFFLTALDARFYHRNLVAVNWVGWIPICYALLAAVACLIGLTTNNKLRLIAGIVLLFSIPVSIAGLWNHTRQYPNSIPEFLAADPKAASGGGPPLLAPLSVAGLGVIAATVVWPTRRKLF